ncbi:MAG: HAF repeat-containing protein [Deltaproteobacteria bacterium]|nr:HAF repeat-containing protein [Deltaproteobacteria bacterium]
MKKPAFCTILLTLGIFLAGALPAVAAPRYTCKKLPPLVPSSVNLASCINNAGQVSGYNETANHAFLYGGGVMQDLGTLAAPYTVASYGYGINDAGQVVGRCDSSSYTIYHAFRYSPGSPSVMLDLGTLPAPYDAACSASGINAAGQVVGTSKSSTGLFHAFLYTDGVMQDLGGLHPTTILSEAYGINAAGQVVGNSYSSSGYYHAFLYSGGVMQDLGALPAPYDHDCYAYAINAAAQVVGNSYRSSPHYPRAFLYSGGGMLDLGALPGDSYSEAHGINAAGQVVGFSYNSSPYNPRAWLYSGGVMLDLNSLVQNLPAGVILYMAYGINDRGQIVVNGSNGAYLLTPVSAPAGLDLLLLQ